MVALFFSGSACVPKIATFCYYQIYFMSEKAYFSPLCQPTIGAHGGRLVEHGTAVLLKKSITAWRRIIHLSE